MRPDLGATIRAMPAFEPEFEGRQGRVSLRGSILPIAAWIASIALLAVMIASAINWRGPIMAAWPPSERLYAALGLTHGPSALPSRNAPDPTR